MGKNGEGQEGRTVCSRIGWELFELTKQKIFKLGVLWCYGMVFDRDKIGNGPD